MVIDFVTPYNYHSSAVVFLASMQVMHLLFVDNEFWHTEKQLILTGKFLSACYSDLLYSKQVRVNNEKFILLYIYFILNVDLTKTYM